MARMAPGAVSLKVAMIDSIHFLGRLILLGAGLGRGKANKRVPTLRRRSTAARSTSGVTFSSTCLGRCEAMRASSADADFFAAGPAAKKPRPLGLCSIARSMALSP